MSKGWHVTFVDGDGKTQFAKVAIVDETSAIEAVTKGRAATGVSVLRFRDGEFEALGMTEGEVIHSAGVN
jgi:hypothetical protein